MDTPQFSQTKQKSSLCKIWLCQRYRHYSRAYSLQVVSIYQHSTADHSNIRQCYSNTHFLIPPLGKRKQTVTQKSSIFIPQMIYVCFWGQIKSHKHIWNKGHEAVQTQALGRGKTLECWKVHVSLLLYVRALPFAFCALISMLCLFLMLLSQCVVFYISDLALLLESSQARSSGFLASLQQKCIY